MRENGILVERTRKFKATTGSNHSFDIAPDPRSIATASATRAALPAVMDPSADRRPSSSPTRVDHKCCRARRTKCQTVVSVPFGGTGANAPQAVLSHGLGAQRQAVVKPFGPRAVETGLNDHGRLLQGGPSHPNRFGSATKVKRLSCGGSGCARGLNTVRRRIRDCARHRSALHIWPEARAR